MLNPDAARELTTQISDAWHRHEGWRVEKGQTRMEETVIRRQAISDATMKIDGAYVDDIPPMLMIHRKDGKLIWWTPGETLPRYAKRVRDSTEMDVAVGDVAYYPWHPQRRRRERGRKYLTWWISAGKHELDLTGMEARICTL